VEKRNTSALLVRMQTGAATMDKVWRFLKKLKTELLYHPIIAPKESENTNSKRYMHLYCYFSIIYNSQDMEAT